MAAVIPLFTEETPEVVDMWRRYYSAFRVRWISGMAQATVEEIDQALALNAFIQDGGDVNEIVTVEEFFGIEHELA